MSKFIDRWRSEAFENSEISQLIYIDVKKKLRIGFHPYSGWRSVPNQNLKTIQINNQGLRSKPIEYLDKNKENCLLFGGSVAWGFGASSNNNIPSSLIENSLSENYNLNYNVINLAEQMHSSFEELNTFINTIDELNPKLVIFLSGTNDINKGLSKNNLFKFTDFASLVANNHLKLLLRGIINERNNYKFFIKLLLRFFYKSYEYTENNFIFKKPSTDIPKKLLYNKMQIVDSICLDKNIKAFHFLQPDLIFKKNRTKSENDYFNFIIKERRLYFEKYNRLIEQECFYEPRIKKNNSYYINLLNIFDSLKQTVFFDQIHFTDFGNKILADKISYEINACL